MRSINKSLYRAARYSLVGLLAASTLVLAQDTVAPQAPADQPSTNSTGWKRADAQSQQEAAQAQNDAGQLADQGGYPQVSAPASSQDSSPSYAPQQQQPYAPPGYGQQPYGQQPSSQGGYAAPTGQQNPYGQNPAPQTPPPPPIPARLTIQAGTYVTVRLNQALSSDHNQPGDAFTGTLADPLVVNGVVVAEPGQTVGGRVAIAEHSRVGGTARLGLQLTNLTLVDGQVVPLTTQFISRAGGTTPAGTEVGAVAATTGLGAAIGAAAGWGTGAAIGAGAGAAAGLIGVMLTHNHASVVYPEQVLTFRLEQPVTISTANAPQAFRYVQPGEYNQANYSPPQGGNGPGAYGPSYPAGPPPAYYGAPYPYYAYSYGYPYYWGPSFAFYYGPGYWWGGRYHGGYYYGHPYYYSRAYYGGHYAGPHGAVVVHGSTHR
ncbi:MAG: hypothetical protein JOY54_20650 [Acidobacteriaceae bacterium]|nr:hypothetical protein [Acidobacteriaceae bacterium]